MNAMLEYCKPETSRRGFKIQKKDLAPKNSKSILIEFGSYDFVCIAMPPQQSDIESVVKHVVRSNMTGVLLVSRTLSFKSNRLVVKDHHTFNKFHGKLEIAAGVRRTAKELFTYHKPPTYVTSNWYFYNLYCRLETWLQTKPPIDWLQKCTFQSTHSSWVVDRPTLLRQPNIKLDQGSCDKINTMLTKMDARDLSSSVTTFTIYTYLIEYDQEPCPELYVTNDPELKICFTDAHIHEIAEQVSTKLSARAK
jgi:hypothetical protein